MIRRPGQNLKLSIENDRGSETSSRYPIHLLDVFQVSGR
jgi:hypothetical protein